tara:strand:- start:8154 stop:8429 length:276 start_codon:yes stop_codon:yes gene_type:complete
MNTKVKGQVKEVTALFEKGDFKKRSLIITTQEEYPQTLEVEFIKTKEELLDVVNVGENVEISVNIKGREWTNPQGEVKYFTSLNGWKVEVK